MYYNPSRRIGPDGRRARGRTTRKRLLAAATREFAQNGYRATTTRAIARTARANPASIHYHFGGKKKLYLRVADAVAGKHARKLLPLIEKSRQEEHPKLASAGETLAELIEAFIRELLDSSDGGAAGLFVVRELSQPGEALTILHNGYLRELHRHVSILLARANGRLPRASEAIVDAHALLGAAIAFVSARTTFKLQSFRPTYTQDRLDAVAAQLRLLSDCMSSRRAPPWSPRSPLAWPAQSSRSRPRGSRRGRVETASPSESCREESPERRSTDESAPP